MKIMSIYTLTMILSLNLLVISCGKRVTDPTLDANAKNATSENDRSAELEKLIRDQADALAKLSADKTTLQERADQLDSKIKALNEQLAMNKSLTAQQRLDMQKQITDLEAQKASLDKQIQDLTRKNTELQNQLNQARLDNERLQRDLNAARAASANNTSTTGSATGATGATSKTYGFKYADPNKVKNDCLGIPGGSTLDNAQLTSAPCVTASQNQQFTVLDPANTFFSIRPRVSNKCLSVISTAEGAAVVQKNCTNTTDQSWEFFIRGAAEFRIRNQYSGKCMKIQSDGKVIQGDCNLNYTNFTWFTAG